MDLHRVLSDQRLEETFEGLQTQLPEKKSEDGETVAADWIVNEIEDQFWETIAGVSDPSKEFVNYDELALSGPWIGRVEHDESSDEGEEQFPWWLRAFEWEFETIGEPVVQLPSNSDSVERLREFDPATTRVYRPELTFAGHGRDLGKLLQGLENIRDELRERGSVELPDRVIHGVDASHPELPERIFDISGNEPIIRTTPAFEDWLESILELCPPYNETTTAMAWYNTGLPREIVERLLGDDVEYLEKAGFRDNEERIANRTFRKAFRNVLSFTGVFDWDVTTPVTGDPSMTRGLDAAYIHMWLSEVETLSESQAEALQLAADSSRYGDDENNEMEYAPFCVDLPITYDGENKFRLTFDTMARKYNGGLYSEHEDRAEKMRQIIEQSGFSLDTDG